MGRYPRWRPQRLGDKLRQIRLSLELSQDGMLGPLGLDESFRSKISNYERIGDPELPILLKYARLAKVSTDVLIDDEQNLPKSLLRKAETGEKLVRERRRRK